MIVIDASVWISALSPAEVRHDVSRRWLFAQFAREERIVVPSLFLSEVAGAVVRRTNDPTLASATLDALRDNPRVALIEGDRSFWLHCASIAAALRLRGADATYVALADLLKAPLFTWDREQLERGAGLVDVRRPVTDR